MDDLIKTQQAPRRAICPNYINTDKRFALDIDDDIWQDVGLTDADGSRVTPPWLCDENVRDGIKAMCKATSKNESLSGHSKTRKIL